MIGGMVETRIAMGFVVPGAFVVEVCKTFFLHCHYDAPAHKLKEIPLCLTLIYVFGCYIILEIYGCIFIGLVTPLLLSEDPVYGGYEGSLTLLKAVGSGCLQSWLLLLKQKTTVVGPVIVSDS